ncbi:MAG: ParA family protein [Microthrixaceae bacterium]
MGITAVVNQKGGVGKTTVTLGLAAAVAELGGRVLVVDMDPQANSTTGLGVWEATGTVDMALATEEVGSIGAVVRSSSWPTPNGGVIHVAPSSPALAQREHQLATDVIGGQDRLAGALTGVVDKYDTVFVDCPPSLGLLTVNALFAADDVLIVAEPAAWSADGVDQILRNIARIAERRSGRPTVSGIVINRLGRTRDGAHWYEQLRETHAGLVIEPPIRLRAAVAEASAHCLPITALTRSGAEESAEEFRKLIAVLHPSRFGESSPSPASVMETSQDDLSDELTTTNSLTGPSVEDLDGAARKLETTNGQVRPEATETNGWR